MLSIKNDFIQIMVNEAGAELSGLKSVKSNIDYLWDADPEVWSSHAPNLFPIIGCLKNDSFSYQGMNYRCPKHGFIRNNKDVSLIDKTESSLSFGLKYNNDYLKIYPFKFEYQITYILKGKTLQVEHHVINHGDEQMLFSLGGHPGFKCPIYEDESYDDYYLEFDKAETTQSLQLQDDGLIGKGRVSVFDEPQIINLHDHLFDNDALVFKNLNSSSVSLKSRTSEQRIIVGFSDFPYLGIWAKPGAEYVCIEPWFGIADSFDSDQRFENKEGLIKLQADKSFSASYSIRVEENNE